MSDDKVSHVGDGAHERLDWIQLDRGLVRRLSSNSGSCHKGRKIRWKRSSESRMLHAERAKYVLLHVVVKRKTRNGFNQVTGQGHAHVRVNNLLAGRSCPAGRVLREEITERNQVCRAVYSADDE